MSNNLRQFRFEDPKKINIYDSCDIEKWSKVFRISEEQLKNVVKAAGVYIDDIKSYIKISK